MGDNLLHSHRKLMYYMNNPSHTMASQWLCFFFTNDLLFSSSATLSHAHTLEPCFQWNHSTLKPPVSLLSHRPPIFLLAYTLNCSHFSFLFLSLFLLACTQLKFQELTDQSPRLSCPFIIDQSHLQHLDPSWINYPLSSCAGTTRHCWGEHRKLTALKLMLINVKWRSMLGPHTAQQSHTLLSPNGQNPPNYSYPYLCFLIQWHRISSFTLKLVPPLFLTPVPSITPAIFTLSHLFPLLHLLPSSSSTCTFPWPLTRAEVFPITKIPPFSNTLQPLSSLFERSSA